MSFSELFEQIKWIPSFDVGIIDIVQIIILSLCIYYLAKSLHKTRAWILVKGLVIIGIVYLVICLTEMTVLQMIIQGLFSSLLIAIVIMLQPELQKLVELIGKKRLTDFKSLLIKKSETPTWYSEEDIAEIISACKDMSKVKTGALIVLERGIPLDEFVRSGINIGASVSSQLLINIFEKNTPLHDGAVIIKDNKIEAATCYLPLSSNDDIDKSLGTRHRAAIGISETTDCIVVVVSEETGEISVCCDGKIQHTTDKQKLTELLKTKMLKSEDAIITAKKKKSKTPIWIKVVAPIISIVVWLSVISSTDPVITRTIYDVSVSTINTDVLDELGQTYFIKSGDTIDVEVQGRRSAVDSMSANDLTAVADFSDMSVVYAVPISVSVNNSYANIEVIKDNSHIMKLELEDLVQTKVPIEINIVGNTNNDYVVSLQDSEISTLTITCTQSLAKTLDKAVLTVDAYGKETAFVSAVKPIVYDKNGSEVNKSKMTFNYEQIRVSMNVYEVKEVPVKICLDDQDKTADFYYILNSGTANTPYLRLAGDDVLMSELKELEVKISPDSNSELVETVLINIKQYLPEGVFIANDQAEQISVELNLTKYKKTAISLKASDIKIVNEGNTKKQINIMSLPKEIVLYYDTSVVDESILNLETLNPTLKVKENAVGQYTANLSLTAIDGTEIVTDLTVWYIIT